MATFLNALLFQVIWFASVMGGAAGEPLWGMLALAVLLGAVLGKAPFKADLALMAGIGLAGFLLDTLWIRLDILRFPGAELAPVWIVTLWLGVALTVNHSLSLFKARPWLGAGLAALCAPLCYLGGERLGAVEIQSTTGLGLVMLAWLVLFAVVFRLAARFPAQDWNQHPSSTVTEP